MKSLKKLFILSCTIIIVFVGFSVADARKAQQLTDYDKSLALEYINKPCMTILVEQPNNTPTEVRCDTPALTTAAINIPVPWMAEQAPDELSLISLPTFVAMTWDPDSFSFADSEPKRICYPAGNPTECLIDVQFQLRVTPVDSSSEEGVTLRNVTFKSKEPQLAIFPYDGGIGESDSKTTTYNLKNICMVGTGGGYNQVLAVLKDWGGYNEGRIQFDEDGLALISVNDACSNIYDELDMDKVPIIDLPNKGGNPLLENTLGERYKNWGALAMPANQTIVVFSEIASAGGGGSVNGAPAYQVMATTEVQLEARVIWKDHEHRFTTNYERCSWDFWDDYDVIRWENWPDPIFCKYFTRYWWGSINCNTLDEKKDCYGTGTSDTWWKPRGKAISTILMNADGEYGIAYDVVVIQAQPLLQAP